MTRAATYAEGFEPAVGTNVGALRKLEDAAACEAATLRGTSPSSKAYATADARSKAFSEAVAACLEAKFAETGPEDVERALVAVRGTLAPYGVDLLALRAPTRAVPGEDPDVTERDLVEGMLLRAALYDSGGLHASGKDGRSAAAERYLVSALDSNEHTQAMSIHWTIRDTRVDDADPDESGLGRLRRLGHRRESQRTGQPGALNRKRGRQ